MENPDHVGRAIADISVTAFLIENDGMCFTQPLDDTGKCPALDIDHLHRGAMRDEQLIGGWVHRHIVPIANAADDP
jgi:hypothetical protein